MLQTCEQIVPQGPSRGLASVAICVATYRRPEGIRRLLQALGKLKFQTSYVPSVQVIVVDNDPHSGTGTEGCRDIENLRWDVKVVAEERRGISFARNRAVQEALTLGADAIAFIDDDEVPDPGWLDGLIQVQRSSGAEAVSGPVLPWFEEPTPAWVIRGKFFDRPRHATGTELDLTRTGNLLLVTRVLKDSGLRFDERFGLSGSEDTLLTLQLRRQGARIVWADEAIVREWVPRERANARYILRRAFAGGNNWTRVERQLDTSSWVALSRGVKAIARIAQGALLLIPSIFLGRHAVVRSAAKSCLGLGALTGVFGFGARFYQ